MHIETIVVGPLATNCYVLSCEDPCCAAEAVIIDPGGDPGKIQDYVERSGVAPVLIVLTHGHSDHMASAAALAAEYGIDVVMHGDDLDTLEMSVADAPRGASGLPRMSR